MTAVSRTRALAQSSMLTATRRVSARRARQATVHTVRQYWSSRHSGSRYTSAGSSYGYLREYPQRGLPRYDEHATSLDRNYMAGISRSRSQPRRRSSSGPSGGDAKNGRKQREDRTHNKSEEHEYLEGKDSWETRTRVAGERYLRLMEGHMKVLRKDPYWGLFGQSELRGVWNPWRNYYSMHERIMRKIADEKPSKPVEKPYEAAEVKADTQIPKYQANKDYRFDPITGRNVPCETSENITPQTKVEESGTGKVFDIPVKKYTSISPRSAVKPTTSSVSNIKNPSVLTGFARQPWLIQEGFVNHSQKASHSVGQEPTAPSLAPGQAKATQDISADASKLPQKTQISNTESSTPRLVTALGRAIEKQNASPYREDLDKRENLDHLRPGHIRAASRHSLEPKQDKAGAQKSEIRWEDIESKVVKMFKDREARLEKEFAADRWQLKRTWSAYPGEILRTMEEKKAQRELLERSFNSGLNKFEHDLAKVLGLGFPASRAKADGQSDDMSIKSYESMSKVAKQIQGMREQLNTRYFAEAVKRETDRKRKASDALLAKEVDQQKTAMKSHESRPHVAKSVPGLSLHSSQKTLEPTVKSLRERIDTSNVPRDETQADKSAKEHALVKEIRSIYEDAYGSISSNTRQPGKSETSTNLQQRGVESAILEAEADAKASKQVLEASVREFEALMARPVPSSPAKVSSTEKSSGKPTREAITTSRQILEAPTPPPSQLFILLAYNKGTDKMRVIRTTSSKYVQTSALRTVDSVLSRLSDPEPYLDYIEQMEKSGYELVAGNAKLLIYKDRLNRTEHQVEDAAPNNGRGWGVTAEEVKPAQSKSDAKAASQDEAKTVRRLPKSTKASAVAAEDGVKAPQQQRIRRLEEAFSGPGPRFAKGNGAPEWSEEAFHEQQRRSRFRRVIRTALLTVAVVYACGISLEWMRERDKERLTKEYQREVQRVKEMERQRAIEERNSSRSYLSSFGLGSD